MDTPFTKLTLFVRKVSFIINTVFLPLLETMYVGVRKLLAEGWDFFTPFVFQLFAVQKGVPEIYPTGGPKSGSRRMLNWDYREDENFSQLHDWLNSQIPCVNFFNFCTYHSESTVAALFENSTNNIISLTLNRLVMTFPSEVPILKFFSLILPAFPI